MNLSNGQKCNKLKNEFENGEKNIHKYLVQKVHLKKNY